MRRFLTFILFIFWSFSIHAQFILEGIVVDAATKEALPFVNITFNNNPKLGTNSDIDGRFKLQHHSDLINVQLSYVGYQNKNIAIEISNTPLCLEIKKMDLALEEIIVIAGENPAYKIIRKVAKNRNLHDPQRIPAYTYDSYNKMRVFDQKNHPHKVETGHSHATETTDSIPSIDFYYTMMEIISKTQYMAPDKRQETIIASKVSGFKDPTFVTAISEIQPTSFHKDNFLILDKEYLNPISNGCIKKYEYRLENTIYQGKDTIYLIRFFPRKNTTFDALKGILYINTNGYAIQDVLAEPATRQKIHLKIEQQYSFINNKKWFPTQLSFEVELAPRKVDTFTLEGKRYISNINLNPALKAKDFGINKITITDDAHNKDSTFWKEH